MDTLLRDIRHALRISRKRPALTLTALATLALGIGATSATFSVVNAALLRPLPFADPDSLVLVWTANASRGAARGSVSHPDFVDYREQSRSFEDLAALRPVGYTLSTPAGAERVEGARAAAGFFELLRVRPALGRTFTRAEDRLGGPRLALVADRLWRRHLGADPGAVGRAITLDRESYTVIGVLPAAFAFPFNVQDAEIWTPLALDGQDSVDERGMHYLAVLGRLKAGVPLDQGRADLAAVGARLEQAYPDSNTGRSGAVFPLHEEIVVDARRGLLVLMGAVAALLLVACANVAHLLLAQATEREREVAIRGALGAGRARLLRQFLTESAVLGLGGGLLGLLLAFWGVEALLALAPADLPRLGEVRLDGGIVAFTLGLALLTSLLFGCVPAFKASRPDLAPALSEGGRGGGAASGAQRRRLRHALVVAEVAVCLVLLTGAGLMLRSLGRILSVDPGFDPEHVLSGSVALPEERYDEPERVAAFYRELLGGVATLPGVQAAAAVTPLPFSGSVWMTFIRDAARPEPPPAERQPAHYKSATSSYFEVMGIPLKSGRAFSEADVRGRTGVVVLNERLARLLFPDQDPVGRQVKFGVGIDEKDEDAAWEIVGVVGDAALDRLDANPAPTFYVSGWQQPWNGMSLVVRSSLEPALLGESIRKQAHALDPDVPWYRVRPLPQLLSGSVALRRFQSIVLSAFAGSGLLLACVGLYGVMAFSVAVRTREIGIRMALGAERRRVLGLLLGHGIGLVALGSGLGLIVALGLARLLESLLFRIQATDPPAYGAATLLLLATATLACYLPARRATRVDPIAALRCE